MYKDNGCHFLITIIAVRRARRKSETKIKCHRERGGGGGGGGEGVLLLSSEWGLSNCLDQSMTDMTLYNRNKALPPKHPYLTIRPVARKGYGSIAHEAKRNGLLTRGPRGRRV